MKEKGAPLSARRQDAVGRPLSLVLDATVAGGPPFGEQRPLGMAHSERPYSTATRRTFSTPSEVSRALSMVSMGFSMPEMSREISTLA